MVQSANVGFVRGLGGRQGTVALSRNHPFSLARSRRVSTACRPDQRTFLRHSVSICHLSDTVAGEDLNITGFVESGPANSSTVNLYTDAGGAPERPCGDVAGAISRGPLRLASCRGPGSSRDEHTLVAVRGRPYWKGGTERSADDVFAAEILAAYRREGARLLDRLHGSFALAIVDVDSGFALLAIDRMGIERMAYAVENGRLLFSTSAETVATSPGRSPRLSAQALYSYLFFHMIPAPETAFEGVAKLAAGNALEFSGGRARVFRYWQPNVVDGGAADEVALGRQLAESLRTAVRAAAPGSESGAFLSGGLDSSTVAGVLSEVGASPARTFSIGFGYADYDELSYARIANQRFGCKGHEYTVHGTDIAQTLPLIARAYDEPFGNSSALPAYHCARLARDSGVGHLLAGDGGDELFAGNSRYAEQQVFEWYHRVPDVLRRGVLEPALAALPRSFNPWLLRKTRGYVEKANNRLPARLEMWNFMRLLGATEILHPEFHARIDATAPIAHMQAVWDSAPGDSLLRRMLWYDWQFTLADNDLRKVETMARLAGVTVSYPMLHPDVVDLSCVIPPRVMMPGRKLRHFYKQAMTGFLPDEIIHKQKHGFGLPFGLWLNESAELRDLIFDSLASLRARDIVRPEFIDRLLSLHGADDARYYGVLIWVLAMLEQWLQEHRFAT